MLGTTDASGQLMSIPYPQIENDSDLDESHFLHPHNLTLCISLYSYTATNNDELTFQENQIIRIVRMVKGGWWEGEIMIDTHTESDGKEDPMNMSRSRWLHFVGWFPSNYVSKDHLHHQHNQPRNYAKSMAELNHLRLQTILHNNKLLGIETRFSKVSRVYPFCTDRTPSVTKAPNSPVNTTAAVNCAKQPANAHARMAGSEIEWKHGEDDSRNGREGGSGNFIMGFMKRKWLPQGKKGNWKLETVKWMAGMSSKQHVVKLSNDSMPLYSPQNHQATATVPTTMTPVNFINASNNRDDLPPVRTTSLHASSFFRAASSPSSGNYIPKYPERVQVDPIIVKGHAPSHLFLEQYASKSPTSPRSQNYEYKRQQYTQPKSIEDAEYSGIFTTYSDIPTENREISQRGGNSLSISMHRNQNDLLTRPTNSGWIPNHTHYYEEKQQQQPYQQMQNVRSVEYGFNGSHLSMDANNRSPTEWNRSSMMALPRTTSTGKSRYSNSSARSDATAVSLFHEETESSHALDSEIIKMMMKKNGRTSGRDLSNGTSSVQVPIIRITSAACTANFNSDSVSKSVPRALP
jgi:hypothetical protein